MPKKKIIFCLQTMVLGGVEKELITILKKFDPEKYDLTVLLCYIQEQEIVKEIPDYVKLIVLNPDKSYWFNSAKNIVKSRIKKGLIFEALKISYKSFKNKGASSAYIDLSKFPCNVSEYDYAVCYHMHSGIMLGVVAEKIKAKYKIAWIHNDFETTGYKINNYKNWLDCYDKFIGVSKKVTTEFIDINPEYKEKSKTVYNVIDENEVSLKAKQTDDIEKCFNDNNNFKIVTVGRFVEQKGFDIAINTCELLKKRGVPLSWYAIGYGEKEEEMRRLIAEKDLKDEFIILGKKPNPYPYMKNADLYVQTSRHEGCPITIDEAMVLKKIIITTNISGASERIDNRKNGIIVPGFSAEELCEVIFELYENRDKMDILQKRINENNLAKSFEEIENVFL